MLQKKNYIYFLCQTYYINTFKMNMQIQKFQKSYSKKFKKF